MQNPKSSKPGQLVVWKHHSVCQTDYNPVFQHVLVYDVKQVHQGLPNGRRCVFIDKRIIQNSQSFFQCINSWGNNRNANLDFPLIPETTLGIEIYSITADWEPSNKNSAIVFTTIYTLIVFLSCCLCIIVCL